MTFLLIETLILRRLSKLNREVMSIALDGRSLPRVTVKRKDEIASLARNVNAMLDRLQKARTELEASYAQVQQGRSRLETLSHRLVEVQEQEKQSIALELHDEIGQSLTALKLRLDSMLNGKALDPQEIQQSQVILNDLIERVRDLSLRLRPAMLDDLGLLPTLLWFFEQYTRQTGITVDFKHQGLEKVRFSQPLELTAYRVIQEGLTNIARHAGVKTAEVHVKNEQDVLGILVIDSGSGFDWDRIEQSPVAAGLSGMRERVAGIGGKLEILSRKGRGTTLKIELPLKGRIEGGHVPSTILLADDHAIVRQGIRLLLAANRDMQVIAEAGDGIQALEMVKQYHPDVAILDIMMPGLNGLEVVRQVHSLTKVIILSMYKDESYVAEALQNGARAFVLKDSSSIELIQAVHAVIAGRRYLSAPFTEDAVSVYLKKMQPAADSKLALLTPRERQVLQLAAEGLTSAETARKLTISPRTVEIHRAHIYEKLDIHTQADLVRFAIREGLIEA